MLTLKEYFSDYLSPEGKGLFSEMAHAPWFDDPDVDTGYLDMMYFTRFGSRWGAPILDTIGQNLKLTDGERLIIGNILWNMYSNKWTRLWNASKLQYEPIENYSMIESGSDTVKHTGTVTDAGTMTHGHKVDTNGDDTGFVAAMNSEDFTSSDSSKGKTSEIHSGEDKTGNLRTNALEDKTSHNLNRHGNIGVTTSQQMLQSEIDLWKWNVFEEVFADINKYITLPIY